MPLISICIPAYNRPELLGELLDSILTQDFNDFEVVICEDQSPLRFEIAQVVAGFKQIYPHKINYYENKKNLGYDGNLRELISKAKGDFCLFMGNDDLMASRALKKVAIALSNYQNIGVLLRSYASFEDSKDNIVQEFKYFEKEVFFPAGEPTIVTFYRRSVVISGMVIHRESALKIATNRFDGTLLYQLYLVANILVSKNAVYLPDIIALYRNGGVPDFGNNEHEKGKFVPKEQTPESSLHFMQGMLDIAKFTEDKHRINVYSPILKDIGNYSYPIIGIQAQKPLFVFLRYCFGLAKLGFWKNKMFYMYFTCILFFGTNRTDWLIGFVKRKLGYTPAIGNLYRGQ